MRIRSTKPEFYRSKTIAELSWADRHVLKALESYVDDNGVGKDDVELFAADAFPRDMFRSAPETFRSLSRALDAFENAGLIVRYEHDGEKLLYVDRWSERQRIDKPSKGRFPRPDGTWNYDQPVNRSAFATVAGGLPKSSEKDAPGTGEQRNRGTEENPSCAPADADGVTEADRFAEFWDAYDKKRGKRAAQQKWRLALKKPGVTADILITAATQYVAGQRARGKHPEFTKDPATWLNGEHWNDEAADGGTASQTRGLLYADEIQTPPPGLTDEELQDWWTNTHGRNRQERDS